MTISLLSPLSSLLSVFPLVLFPGSSRHHRRQRQVLPSLLPDLLMCSRWGLESPGDRILTDLQLDYWNRVRRPRLFVRLMSPFVPRARPGLEIGTVSSKARGRTGVIVSSISYQTWLANPSTYTGSSNITRDRRSLLFLPSQQDDRVYDATASWAAGLVSDRGQLARYEFSHACGGTRPCAAGGHSSWRHDRGRATPLARLSPSAVQAAPTRSAGPRHSCQAFHSTCTLFCPN